MPVPPASRCQRTAGPHSCERFLALAAAAMPSDPRPELRLDLALPAAEVDYALLREVAQLAPTGPGNPDPLVAVFGLTVTRVRAASGGHTQLTLKRRIDVLDAIAFDRADLAETVHEGDRVDVVARVMSRTFGGYRIAAARDPRRGDGRLARRVDGRDGRPRTRSWCPSWWIPTAHRPASPERPRDPRGLSPRRRPPRLRLRTDPTGGRRPLGHILRAGDVGDRAVIVACSRWVSSPAGCRSRRRTVAAATATTPTRHRPRQTSSTSHAQAAAQPVGAPAAPTVPGSIVFAKQGNIWAVTDFKATQLTNTGRDSMPSWSADGQWIYFIETAETRGLFPSQGAARYYTLTYPILTRVRANGTGRQSLLSGLYKAGGGSYQWFYWIRQPVVAPDGKTVALLSDGPDPTRSDVVLQFYDTRTGKLTRAPVGENPPLGHQDVAWRPDGKVLLYVKNARDGTRGAPAIWQYNPVSKRTSALTGPGYNSPTFSPDGKWIAATRTSPLGTDVVILNAGRGPRCCA